MGPALISVSIQLKMAGYRNQRCFNIGLIIFHVLFHSCQRTETPNNVHCVNR